MDKHDLLLIKYYCVQEEDEENEEEGDGCDAEYEEVMVSRNLLAAFMEDETPQSSKRRAWDDEFVLKRQFSALIPAFDPRPGRTNINQVNNMSDELHEYRPLKFFTSGYFCNRQRIWRFLHPAAKRRSIAVLDRCQCLDSPCR